MIKVKLIAASLIFLCPFFCLAQNFGGNAPSIKWKQINVPKAKVIFPQGLDSQANRIANIVTLLDSATSNTIGGYQCKWNIVLQNQTTIPNAYVRLAPVISELYMVPPQDNFSQGSVRWDDNLIIHEERHMQQFSNFNKGLTKLFSFFLGQQGQLLANGIFLPDYFYEGDAVWQETLVSAQGRGRMPSFFNGFKSLWAENKNYSWWKYRSGSLKDFVPDLYPVGYILVSYGYEKYGNNFWEKVTSDAVRARKPFYKAIEKYAAISFKQFRQDAISYFKNQSAANEKNNAEFKFVTQSKKNNVIDYQYPHFINDTTIIVTKKSFKQIPAFYILAKGKEERIRVKNYTLDDYFSYRNGKIVYASYQSDERWGNKDYSVIQLLDIQTKKQRQLTFKSKYFSPDINEEGTEIIAVDVKTNGTNNLIKLNIAAGKVVAQIPNPKNYFFTQTKYLNNNEVVAAVRSPEGKMALVKVKLANGESENITPFSFNLLGYPFIKGDTIFFSMMNNNADKIFAVTLYNNKMYRITNNTIGVYHPSVNAKGEIIFSAFTASGQQLATMKLNEATWNVMDINGFETIPDLFTPNALKQSNTGVLYSLKDKKSVVTNYKKSFQLFNFHSFRPVVAEPEYGYNFYSDNILSSFTSAINYTYNRDDKSSTIGFSGVYAGWLPQLSMGINEAFNRTIDTAVGKSVSFNAATVNAGFSVPLNFVGGRTNKYLNFGSTYNIEQYYYNGVGKNIFNNKAINYINSFISFSNVGWRALQHINPRWAQSISLSYSNALNFRDSHKFVGRASLYFPGLFVNHSLVLNAAYQNRDSLPDLFSNIFPYARGYQALSTRRMYKLGANYHFPIFYPDWGFANIIYFQRIRSNIFYDYNNAKARVNGNLTEIINRSIGTEIYFDTKVWGALLVTLGFRVSHLLDTDLINPGVKNKWEFILPVALIPATNKKISSK